MKANQKLTLKQLKKISGKSNFDQTVSDLKNAFMRDFNIRSACRYAGLSPDTYYRWLTLSDEFAEMMEKAKDFVTNASLTIIVDQIKDKKNVDLAKWYLERRDKKRFAQRTELSGDEGGAVQVNLSNFTKKDLEKMTTEQLIGAANEQL